jgi:hypothetical protein
MKIPNIDHLTVCQSEECNGRQGWKEGQRQITEAKVKEERTKNKE